MKLMGIQRQIFCRSAYRQYTTTPLASLFDRGFVKEVFPNHAREQIEELTATPQHIYAGFDPTADSLHIGNLLVIIGLIHFQRAGHQPIALIGGATGRIGDPSGKSTERNALAKDELNHNLKCIKKQLHTIFENHSKYLWNENLHGKLKPVKLINNEEWYQNLSFLDFISNIGRHFRIGAMMSLTSVKERMENDNGISFTEFSYQICQALDWWQLFKEHNCQLKLGGSDQLGNISAGHHLIKRMEKKKDAFGVTIPILTTRDGKKLGKSEGNAIWLDETKTTPFSLYQYFVRTPDDQVESLLKMLTFFSLEEIDALMAEQKEALHLRKAPQRLAEQMTLLIHGEEGLKKAKQVTAALYEGNFEALSSLTPVEMKSVFDGAKVYDVMLEPGMTVNDSLLLMTVCDSFDFGFNRIVSSRFTGACSIMVGDTSTKTTEMPSYSTVLDGFRATGGNKGKRETIKMPSEHYMIEAQLILQCAPEDISHSEKIRTAIKDIIDIRAAKLRTSMDDFMKGDGTYAKLDNLTIFEIHSVRPLLPYSLDLIDRLHRTTEGRSNQSTMHTNQSSANFSLNSSRF